MRVYVPSTVPGLASLTAHGEVGPAPFEACAVTPALREWYKDGDLPELEYAALSEAAVESLRLLAADETAPRRRVVVAADVPDERVVPVSRGRRRAAVRVEVPVFLGWVAAAHVDDRDAVPDVAAAVAALAGAEAGDPDAQFTVDGADGHDLQWFATQELVGLLTSMDPPGAC